MRASEELRNAPGRWQFLRSAFQLFRQVVSENTLPVSRPAWRQSGRECGLKPPGTRASLQPCTPPAELPASTKKEAPPPAPLRVTKILLVPFQPAVRRNL